MILMWFFKDPNEDTEWNDILRSKGILPAKEPEITEESLVNMVEQAIENKMNSECKKPIFIQLTEITWNNRYEN